jgi:quinoprotein glucose dehydrogenase
LLHCASCHGADKRGSHDGTYPSLVNVQNKLSGNEIYTIIQKGKGRMSAFSHLPKEHLITIRDYLVNKADKSIILKDTATRNKTAYRHTGYNRWYKDGYPVNQPPWGTLTAIDLNTGDRNWQVPLGEYPDLTAKGVSPTGTDNYGGPLVTAAGLIFIAASRDEQFRAFDKTNGKILWQTKLPAAGYASPSTYSVNGKQFIVIACGGGKLNTRSGDSYIAFSLED